MAGLAAGWLVEGRHGRGLRAPREPHSRIAGVYSAALSAPAFILAAAGMLPDVDLLFGAHSGPTHGVGAAIIAAGAALGLTRSWRWAGAVGAAYASHLLLDWLGTDTTPPIGIMALWPFTREYFQSSLHVFLGVSRELHSPSFWSDNLRAFVRELLVLVPVLAAVSLLRWKRSSDRRDARR